MTDQQHAYKIIARLKQPVAGESVVMKNIFFDNNKFDLKKESFSELNRLVAFLKNSPNVSIEIGGHTDAVGDAKLNLTLSESTIQKGYDAVDSDGKTYQVKSRMVYATDQQTSFDFTSLDHKFDYLIAVFFSKDLDVIKIIKVPYEAVLEHAVKNKTNYRFRWHKGMSGNTYIEDIL